jgi:hypothetical protein
VKTRKREFGDWLLVIGYWCSYQSPVTSHQLPKESEPALNSSFTIRSELVLSLPKERCSRASFVKGQLYQRLVCFLIIVILCSLVFSGLLDIPISDELYDEVYNFIDVLSAKKLISGMDKNTRPYSYEEVIHFLKLLQKKVESGDAKLTSIEEKKLKQYLELFSSGKSFQSSAEGVVLSRRSPTRRPGGRRRPDASPPDNHQSTIQGSSLFQSRGKDYWFAADLAAGWDTIYRGEAERKTAQAVLFRPTVSGQIKDNFAFYSDLKVYYLSKTQFPDIPKREVIQEQYGLGTATAALSRYYAKFKLPWFEVSVGKDNLSWGPGRHGALLISDNPLPMEMAKLSALFRSIKFNAFTSILEGKEERRYLSGHRLELSLWDKINLGIAETIVYTPFKIDYLNPLQIYTIDTAAKIIEVKENPSNVLISGDLDLLMLRNLELYGELMIDDFVPTRGLRSFKNWGSKFGVLLGGYYVEPFSLKDTALRIEYAFINQYAYTHDPPITSYTHLGSVIGHQIGTDADDLYLDVKHWLTDKLSLSLSYELERHGEGDVNKPHSEDTKNNEEWEFLSGTTESTHSIRLCASYNLTGKYSVALEYTHSWIKNTNHQVGVNLTKNQVLLSGQYRF